jgi:hypothetical protein
MSYFKTFVCPEGGVDSGFNKVEAVEYKPRLFQISGHKSNTLVVRQVPLSCNSLNKGDVFVLDAGTAVYQWNGEGSSGKEKNKSSEYCHAIANSRKNVKVSVFGIILLILDQDDKDAEPFWTAVGGKGSIAESNEINSPTHASKVLLCVSDSTGTLKSTVVARDNEIKASMLKSDDCFILDTGSDVFIWVGKSATADEKKSAMSIAMKYL